MERLFLLCTAISNPIYWKTPNNELTVKGMRE